MILEHMRTMSRTSFLRLGASRRLWTLALALTAALLVGYSASIGSAEELTATEIVKKMDQLLRGKTSVGTYEMTVVTPNWERTLRMDAWSIGNEMTFIRITSPAKEAGVGSLRIETNMWDYLPKVERIIKIPPSMMMQPWMGSDFTNDDLVKESSVVKDYTHELLGKEDIDGFNAYKIALIPKPDAPVVWGKVIAYVRASDFVPLREEYYTEKGKLVRVLTFSDIKKMDDRVIPTTWVMQPVDDPGKHTMLKIEKIVFNQSIPENVFTLENLKHVK
jgi:outer membrane lipoprotein-sorting protein